MTPAPIRRAALALALLNTCSLAAAIDVVAPDAPASRASAPVPARADCPRPAPSSPQDAARPSSKLRHAPDEAHPCGSTMGRGRPEQPLAGAHIGGREASAPRSDHSN